MSGLFNCSFALLSCFPVTLPLASVQCIEIGISYIPISMVQCRRAHVTDCPVVVIVVITYTEIRGDELLDRRRKTVSM